VSGLGTSRLALRGLRTAPGVSALIALLVLVATLVAVGAPRQTAGALTSALREDLAPAAGQIALSADLTTPYIDPDASASIAPVWSVLPARLAKIRTSLVGVRDVTAPGEFAGSAKGRDEGYDGSGTATTPVDIRTAFTLEATPALHREARLVAGRWPGSARAGSPIEVVIAAKAARTLGWRIGQSQTLATSDADGPTVTLVGTVAPRDPGTAFWGLRANRADVALQQAGLSDTKLELGTVWLDDASWPRIGPTLDSPTISAWYGIDLGAVTTDRASVIAADVRRALLRPVPLGSSLPQELAFRSDLPANLADFARRSGPSVALIALFELGPAGALAAVLLLGLRLLQARRAIADALIRARGASERQRRLLAAAEIAVWTLPAAVIGGALAVLLTPGGGASPTAVITAIVCGIAAPIAAAALAERLGSPDRRSVAARAAGPVAELAAVLLAALALTVLVARGPVTAASGIDPLVELAPLLLAIAVTVVLLRVLPFATRAIAVLQRRARGAVGLVAAASTGLARRGGAWALFALVVGVGMSVFSLTMVATQQHGVERAALSRTGSDVAVASTTLDAGTVRDIGAIRGVAAHAEVDAIDEQSDLTIYTVDRAALASVQRDIDGSPLAPLRGRDAIASRANGSATTTRLDATGDATLRLHLVEPAATTTLFSDPHWVLVDRAQLRRDDGIDPQPVGVLLRLRPGADADAVASEARRLAGEDASARIAAHEEATIVGSPLDRAVHAAILGAMLLTALLCLVVFVMTLAAGAAERLRRGAILRALGFDRRQAAALVVADVAPLAVAGAVAGALTGIGLAAAVLHTIAPTGFVGAPLAPTLTVDVPTTLLALLAFLAAAAVAAGAAVLLDLSRPATAGLSTLGEER